MKDSLIKICWPVLKYFESGDEPYQYKPSHRTILIIMGLLFSLLSTGLLLAASFSSGYGFLIPVVVFFGVGFICMIVGFLGSDRAVSKIWGSR